MPIEESDLNNLSIIEHINHYMMLGMDQKEAQKAVASDRGVSKREIYAELVRAKEQKDAE